MPSSACTRRVFCTRLFFLKTDAGIIRVHLPVRAVFSGLRPRRRHAGTQNFCFFEKKFKKKFNTQKNYSPNKKSHSCIRSFEKIQHTHKHTHTQNSTPQSTDTDTHTRKNSTHQHTKIFKILYSKYFKIQRTNTPQSKPKTTFLYTHTFFSRLHVPLYTHFPLVSGRIAYTQAHTHTKTKILSNRTLIIQKIIQKIQHFKKKKNIKW